ncbi:U-scoloptoxin(19)-Sm1a-like [Maniola hyperantus]|uniref:U-scoloptoxin(19)-Sm1a-like n=1 Tax=Aphantopus hyperantus TaxID=2795564 RepID=UPI00156911E1|nr:U-scoloptoxin(19)-Sm1a-like [Maniola hyperantus]
MKVVLFAFLLVGVVCGNDQDLRVIDSIVIEQPCLEEGGSCVIAADCPEGLLANDRGLCPKQQARGVECCYGISVKETRCEKRGGECMPKDKFCNPRIVFQEATDCCNDEKCCILV